MPEWEILDNWLEQNIHSKAIIGHRTPDEVLWPDGIMEYPWWMTPKANQAKHMRKLGINTPNIFINLDEWLNWLIEQGVNSWESIYIRSEHPDDGKINARSWIFDTLEVSYLTENGDSNPYFYSPELGMIKPGNFRKVFKKWVKKQVKKWVNNWYDTLKLWWTFWQWIYGHNYTVVGDKNVPWVYFIHPIRAWEVDKTPRRVDFMEASWFDSELIKFYQGVQSTNQFWEAPIIEIQVKQGTWGKIDIDNMYFLQALTTSDWEKHNWVLDRQKESGEIEVYFVRGITSPDGIVAKILMVNWFEYHEEWEFNGFYVDSYWETGQYAMGYFEPMVEEIASTESDKILIIWIGNDRYSEEWGWPLWAAVYHSGISSIHKPKISLIIDRLKFPGFSRNSSIKIRIISDGKRAFIKFLD